MDESSTANRSQAGLATVPPRTYIAERYHVLRVLGEGSSGIVYLCEHTALAKEVAVKVLHRELADNAGLVARFTREAQTAARLDHPNSVHVMDFGQDRDGMLYLAMEYVDGPDLAQLLDEGLPLDDERIVHFMSCILSALSAAHALGIVHRDLKPENVLVRLAEPGSGAPDTVKVCDFGVAQLSPVRLARTSSVPISPDAGRVTGEGMMVGTPWYMSPEQARAEALDARSDIYSAGVVLFQLLTRTLPFMGDDVMAVAIMHCTTPPPPPSGYGAVHPGLEAVCLKALSKTPEARYQSAAEMLSALHEAVSTQVGRRSLARVSRTSLTSLVPVSARPELTSTTPLAAPSVRQQPAVSRRVKPSLLVAGVATTLLGVAAVPRFLPSQHAVVTTLSAAASRSVSMLDQTFGARGAPQPVAADAPIQDDPELGEPLPTETSPLSASQASPAAATELGLPDLSPVALASSEDGLPEASAGPNADDSAKPAAALLTAATSSLSLRADNKPALAPLTTASSARVSSAPSKPATPASPSKPATSPLTAASASVAPAVTQGTTGRGSAASTKPGTSPLLAAASSATAGRPAETSNNPSASPLSAAAEHPVGPTSSGESSATLTKPAGAQPSAARPVNAAAALAALTARPASAAQEEAHVPDTAGEAAASAAAIALATLPAAAPVQPKAAAAPVASAPSAKASEAPAKPTTPVKFARVEIAAEHLPPGTSRVSLRSALNQVALLGCYAQAQQHTPTAQLTGTALELKTNTSGRIVSAHADNSALPHPLRECLEQVARSGNIRTGEGGEVHVTVNLLPSP